MHVVNSVIDEELRRTGGTPQARGNFESSSGTGWQTGQDFAVHALRT